MSLDLTDTPVEMPHYTDTVLKAMAKGAGCRRHGGRLRQEALRCNLGVVLDISATGMRILAKSKRRGTVTVELEGRLGKMNLPSEVVWSRRVGFRRHQVGLRFVKLDAKQTKQLRDLMFSHRHIMPEAA